MEEKVLIKSEMDKKARSVLQAIMWIGLGLGLFLFLLLLREVGEGGYWRHAKQLRIVAAFDGVEVYLVQFIVACVFLLFGIVALIIYLVTKNCEIVVTDKNVRGRARGGREVVLPLDMVSAYATGKFLSTISVSTASGVTAFSLIGNYAEIGSVLAGLINERQSASGAPVAFAAPPAPADNALDNLAKLKALLDSGVITQEEFDAKKKQILGL